MHLIGTGCYNWQKIDILIDTGASSSYISKSLTFMLDLNDLEEPITYINFNGENFVSQNTVIH